MFPLENFVDGIWLLDFEYTARDGDRPEPICMVAHELHSKRSIKLWQDELHVQRMAPFPVNENSLVVSYYSSAEISCFLSLGWPVPLRILDLYAEFKNLTSGLPTTLGSSLLGALAHFGIDGLQHCEKAEMRALAMRGGPYNESEKKALLEYCESDVIALSKLIVRMLPQIDLPRAPLRGRSTVAIAKIEWDGIPIDVEAFQRIRSAWSFIQSTLIETVDQQFNVYEGRTFKEERFEAFLNHKGIVWPLLESGRLSLCDDTFREMSKIHPIIAPLRELRNSLGELRLEKLTVGCDGRNRCLLSPFASTTGRNQPSNSKFIFGTSVWLRSLIKPRQGYSIAYIDFEQQEFGIAAALSGDRVMQEAYLSGDPYLAFAKQAGAVPVTATAESHSLERSQYKQCVLAVQYGMGAKSLACRISKPEAEGRNLLQSHREAYPKYWKWSQAAINHGMLFGKLYTVFGWHVHVGKDPNPRSLANFPMQANAAEILRLSCCLATERGVSICAPVHDAVLIEASVDQIDDAIFKMRQAMSEASKIVLNGFELRSSVEQRVSFPDRYMDKRGKVMWEIVQNLLK